MLSTPNGRALDEALEEVDYMISVDPALNETTRHADIILPPTSPLEHDHYDIAFHNLAIRNTARYNPPVFAKPEGALHDWEIFAALGERVASRLNLEPMPTAPPDRLVDAALRAGPYGEHTEWQLSIEKLKAHPSGIDLGPLQPSCPDRLQNAESAHSAGDPGGAGRYSAFPRRHRNTRGTLPFNWSPPCQGQQFLDAQPSPIDEGQVALPITDEPGRCRKRRLAEWYDRNDSEPGGVDRCRATRL